MEDANSTDSLRLMAPKWSLAGDDQLMNLLQKTHDIIVSKCQDVNSKLEEMSSALDDASINLQNVNNKFMALNNSQFIESRVYEDDISDVQEVQATKELPHPSPVDEIRIIKNSLAVLEQAHEIAEIMDDSDSDSDMEISVVLKPKDMYSHRPLPYIIGSQPWKNKWHAGLIEEDSDSDSSTSKHDVRDIEQYSDSESEQEQMPRPQLEDRTISETSSSFNSEHPIENIPPVKQKPSDIAAELARRLGGPPQAIVQQEPEVYSPPVPATRKVYKPDQPATSTIFSDEPPPLDAYEQQDEESEDDDIFAEINKNKPYTQQRNTTHNNLADDLFSFDKPDEIEQGDIFNDFAPGHVTKKPVTQKSSLFKEESEPELFPEITKKDVMENNNSKGKEESSTKKPLGGISIFGSNKGTESIGAAILNRNRRKSSTTGDESGSDTIQKRHIEDKPKTVHKPVETAQATSEISTDDIDNKPLDKKERDIFDDLFAKPEKIVKETPVNDAKKEIKDLFSDNIFDDIDDIFTSNVKIPVKDSKQKSIFNDDSDLFSDIDKPKSIINQNTISKDSKSYTKKSIFDSDDDLFTDAKVKKEISAQNIESQDKYSNTALKEEHNLQADTEVKGIVKTTETPQCVHEIRPAIKNKSILDSDSDEDIFANIKIPELKKTKETKTVYTPNDKIITDSSSEGELKTNSSKLLVAQNIKAQEKLNYTESPSLFEEDEIDDLFINANTSLNKQNEPSILSEDMTSGSDIISSIPNEIYSEDITSILQTGTIFNDHIEANIPKVFNKSEQIDQEKSSVIPNIEVKEKTNIFDNHLQNENIISFQATKQAMINQNIAPKYEPTDVIESSQNQIVESKDVFFEAPLKNITNDDEIPQVNPYAVIDIPKQGTNQHVLDDFNETVEVKVSSTSLQNKQFSNEPNVFDDIFAEPPVFEKPMEPKKSKNVNALFDDDSDDESLFFKKNDVIPDEKPEIFSNAANFGLFGDEPPAIDVQFSIKSSKTVDFNSDKDDTVNYVQDISANVPDCIKNIEIDAVMVDIDSVNSMSCNQESIKDNSVIEVNTAKEVLSISNKNKVEKDKKKQFIEKSNKAILSTPKEDKHTHISIDSTISNSDDDLFSTLPKPDSPKTNQNLILQNETFKANVFDDQPKNKFDDMFKSKESPKKKETETKKIGKIDTKNFNINVSALVPGASPKKISKENNEYNALAQEQNVPKLVKILPTTDDTDHSLPQSPTNETEIFETNKAQGGIEPRPDKMSSFEKKTESEILDNNASKQRARIQVKRRPSSRRARHEAVRKSAIDFGDDTDNSSSIDEPVKSVTQNLKSELEKSKKVDIDSVDNSTIFSAGPSQDSQLKQCVESQNLTATETVCKASNNDIKILTSNPKNEEETFVSDKIGKEKSNDETKNLQEHKSTTKVVYILNDEDIFNTSKNEKAKANIDLVGNKNVKTESTNIFENKDITTICNDDIFKNEGVNTLGNTYNTNKSLKVIQKDHDTAQNKTGDNSSTKNENKDIKTKKKANTSLFDDSDEELFNQSKKVVQTSSIFDSDSEDDLFSGKKKTEKDSKEHKNQEVRKSKDQKNQEVKRKEVNVKVSLFSEDSDDDLFGVKKEKNETITRSFQQSTSIESSATTASKMIEPVFDDPLSLLGDDD